MKKKRVSIRDIATAMSVTPSTVSRALNNGEKVSEKKRKEIVKLAKELGYRPNPIAKSMVGKRTYNIGLLLPEFTHHFFNRILAGIEHITSNAGYHLLICTSDELKEKEIKSCSSFIDARVDGIIAAVGNKEDDLGHFKDVLEAEIPLVLIDRICEDLDVPYVITDDFQGAFNAVAYLINSGCSRILHIKGPNHLSTSFNRWMGYKQALKQHNIAYEKRWVVEGDQNDLKAILETLLCKEKIDGVFGFSDYYAYTAYQVIGQLGKSIPDDISIIGYADEPMATYINPQLSTVYQPAFEMGQKAAETLLNMIEKGTKEANLSQMETKLVLRETTKQV